MQHRSGRNSSKHNIIITWHIYVAGLPVRVSPWSSPTTETESGVNGSKR